MYNIIGMKASISKIKRDLDEMTHVQQLIDYIPCRTLESLAYFILVAWVLSPILVKVYAASIPSADALDLQSNKMMANILWFVILQQCGYLGWILTIVSFAKSRRIVNQKGTKFKQYLAGRQLPFFLFLMLVWSTISCIFSNNPGLSFLGTEYRKDGLMTYFAYAGIFCCGLIQRDRHRVRKLLSIFVLAAVALAIPNMINWQPSSMEFFYVNNASLFMNINHYGYYLCLTIMSSLMLFMTENKNRWMVWVWAASYAILTADLVLNTSIGPYLAVIGGLLLGMIFYFARSGQQFQFDRQTRRRLVFSLIFFIGLSLVINSYINLLGQDLVILAQDSANIAQGSPDAVMAGRGRWTLWRLGIQFITEKPWFGYGPENLEAQYHANGVMFNNRPHNELIQFAASLGVPAMLLYVAGLSAHLREFLKARKKIDLQMIGTFTAIGTYLMSSFFGNTMFYTTPFFFMILGLSYGMLRNQDW